MRIPVLDTIVEKISTIDANWLARKNLRVCHFINRIVYGIQVNTEVYIPPTLEFAHGMGIVIGYGVKLGENVKIYQNTTLGAKDEKLKKYPIIGNNVTIFANCVIVGGITIGDNSIIGACTFVDKDIPPNSIVYGNRELIIKPREKI